MLKECRCGVVIRQTVKDGNFLSTVSQCFGDTYMMRVHTPFSLQIVSIKTVPTTYSCRIYITFHQGKDLMVMFYNGDT